MVDPPPSSVRPSEPVPTVAVIGAGVLGTAVVRGLVRGGFPESALTIGARGDAAPVGGVLPTGLTDACGAARMVMLAVPPTAVLEVLAQIAPALRPGAIVVSLAAGVTCATVEAALPAGTTVVRAVPNTPVALAEGVTALSRGVSCTDAQLASVGAVLRRTGAIVEVPERCQDTATSLSGAGPAYVFYLVQAMIAAAVQDGMAAAEARVLASHTVRGAAGLLLGSALSPEELRRDVCTPGGCTAAALSRFDEGGVGAAVRKGMAAARDRAGELGVAGSRSPRGERGRTT